MKQDEPINQIKEQRRWGFKNEVCGKEKKISYDIRETNLTYE